MFNVTLNKPAVRHFLDEDGDGGKVGGLRIKVEDGKLMFKPSERGDAAGVIKVEKRTRGGYVAIVEGKLADQILSEIDTSTSHFFSLTRRRGSYGWITANPFEEAGDPPKFVPHLRIWRPKKAAAARPKVAESRRRTVREPAATAAPTRRRRQINGQPSTVRVAGEQFVVAFLKEHPDFLQQHPELIGTGKAKPGRRRRAASASVETATKRGTRRRRVAATTPATAGSRGRKSAATRQAAAQPTNRRGRRAGTKSAPVRRRRRVVRQEPQAAGDEARVTTTPVAGQGEAVAASENLERADAGEGEPDEERVRRAAQTAAQALNLETATVADKLREAVQQDAVQQDQNS